MISGNINSIYFSIYNCGEMVVESMQYYLKWLDSEISSGYFTINGSSYNFSEYSGYFPLSNGRISGRVFFDDDRHRYIYSIETTATYLNSGAFSHRAYLTQISLPNCSYIGNEVFYYCSGLSSANLPKCTYIGSYAFTSASVSIVSAPQCVSIDYRAFESAKVNTLYCPSCLYIGSYAFSSCSYLYNVDLTSCQSIGERAFAYCSRLPSITLPNCEYISEWAFADCTSLSIVSLNKCSSLGRIFTSCPLISVYLLYSGVCSLDNYTFGTYNFSSSFKIYVPYSLLSDYISTYSYIFCPFSQKFVAYLEPRPVEL